MSLTSSDAKIACRNLCLEKDKAIYKVSINIYQPRLSDDGACWVCFYQILGIGDELPRYGAGADAVQALLLALTKVGADIYSSPEAKSFCLSWENSPNLGLPVFIKELLPAVEAEPSILYL